MTTSIFVTLNLPGYHRWPLASGKRSYLAHRHRHLFGIRAEVAVTHDDRDIEFHDLSDNIREWWGSVPREWEEASCESIARQLLAHLTLAGLTVISITVSEDSENGATITTQGETNVHDH